MKILLVNQNKMVGKLFENIAKKLDLELVAEEHVEKILPTLEESKECFFFADDTAVDGEEYEHLKPHLEGVQLSGLLLRKGIEEFGEFTHYIKKPFLPTDILHILQRSMGPTMLQSSPSLPKDIEAVSAESDADFFKDIDSSLNQLEGLLDPIALTSQEPPKEESREEPPATPQETAITEPTEQPQNTAEESKAAQTTETAKEETAKEAPKEDTPPQEAHDPLALNLDDLLPVDDSEDETHAGLEHDEMLEDLVQEDSPKAQDLMDNMQAMGDLMQSAKHEIEETTESDLQPLQESPASKESSLDQDPTEVLESDAKKGAESTEEPKAEPVEPDSQPTENTQVSELKNSEDLDNLELEPPAATLQPESIAQEPTQEAPTEPELEQESQMQPESQAQENAQEDGAQENLEQLDLEDLGDLDNLELEVPTAQPQAEPTKQEPIDRESKETESTTLESAQEAPTEPELEQAPIELETKTPQGTEPTEQEPQAQESVEQLELELDEAPKLETQNLETGKPQGNPELELEPQEINPPQPPQAELETVPTKKDTQESQVELEKDPQEYEHIEDIPEPVMSSVVDGSYEAPQTPSPKAPRADIEQIPTELEDLAAEEPLVEGESPKPEITKDPEEAPEESLEQAPQEQETPQESAPTAGGGATPLHLSFDLQDLLKDLPIDPKLLEGKTLKIQVNLADKDG